MKKVAKIWIILKSRFKKSKEEDWIKQRRGICLGCKFNSINTECKTLAQDFLANLSYFYSWLFGRAKKDHECGTCTLCGCPINLKIQETEEEYQCEHPEGNQWKRLKIK